jgi:hypothetical protein
MFCSLTLLALFEFPQQTINHPFIHSSFHPFIHSCIDPFIHSCIHPSIHPPTHPSKPPINRSNNQPFKQTTQWLRDCLARGLSNVCIPHRSNVANASVLQVPAPTIKAYARSLFFKGHISFEDSKALLTSQPVGTFVVANVRHPRIQLIVGFYFCCNAPCCVHPSMVCCGL